MATRTADKTADTAARPRRRPTHRQHRPRRTRRRRPTNPLAHLPTRAARTPRRIRTPRATPIPHQQRPVRRTILPTASPHSSLPMVNPPSSLHTDNPLSNPHTASSHRMPLPTHCLSTHRLSSMAHRTSPATEPLPSTSSHRMANPTLSPIPNPMANRSMARQVRTLSHRMVLRPLGATNQGATSQDTPLGTRASLRTGAANSTREVTRGTEEVTRVTEGERSMGGAELLLCWGNAGKHEIRRVEGVVALEETRLLTW